MADRIVVNAIALEAAQSTLKKATENAQQCAKDAQETISQLQGEWEGAAASSYIDLLSQITPKMEEAATVYQEIATKLKSFSDTMTEVDQGF